MKRTFSHTRRRPYHWTVRNADGELQKLTSLTEMARLILEGQMSSDDEISSGDGQWKRVADILDTRALTVTLAALGHLAH